VISSETKTKDNVFIKVDVAVQYEVMSEKIYDAFYRLQDPKRQITSYVFDGVRSNVPKLGLDDVFAQKDDIANAIEEALESHMTEFGYSIVKVLVIDLVPDEKVQAAMNDIQAATREAQAAAQKGEASKVLIVKAAEADAEAKALAGKGIADERSAIVKGLRESVEATAQALHIDAKDVMQLVMMTQYFDTLKEIGKQGTTIMLPSTPAGLEGISNEIRSAIVSAGRA